MHHILPYHLFSLLTLLALTTVACGKDDTPQNTRDMTTVIMTPDDMGNMSMDEGNMSTDMLPSSMDMLPDEGGQSGVDMPGIPTPDCPGVEVRTDGALNLDLERVRIQGNLALNGAPLPLPDEGFSAGSLLFTHVDSIAHALLPLSGMQQTYTIDLKPGTYHIDYIGDFTACSKPETPSLYPCNQGRLLSDVVLSQQGILDVNIPAVSVQGTITLNDDMLPEFDGAAPGIFVQSEDSLVITHTLDTERRDRYRMTLLPGRYDLGWDGDESRCSTADDPSPLPCNDGILKEALELEQSGTLDLDVPSIKITGRVTLNDGPLEETDGSASGMLSWQGAEPVPVITRAYTPGETSQYAVHLLPGTYDVSWVGNPAYCDDLEGKQDIPCHTGVLEQSLELGTSGSLNFNMNTARLYGRVTFNGSTPDDEYDDRRGMPMLINGDQDALALPVKRDGDTLRYTAVVLHGAWRIGWSGNPELCQDPEADHAFPCHAGVFGEPRDIQTSGELAIDVPSVKLTGAVTLDGAQLPDEAQARGQLSFEHAIHAPALTATFDPEGAATYRMVLLPGNYDVSWRPDDGLCTTSLEMATRVPCFVGYPIRGQMLEVSGSLNVDLEAVTLTGELTQMMQTLPEPMGSGRGNLRLTNTTTSQSLTLPGFETEGPARYAITLYPGDYLFSFDGDPAHCAQGREDEQTIVCGTQVVRGCD